MLLPAVYWILSELKCWKLILEQQGSYCVYNVTSLIRWVHPQKDLWSSSWHQVSLSTCHSTSSMWVKNCTWLTKLFTCPVDIWAHQFPVVSSGKMSCSGLWSFLALELKLKPTELELELELIFRRLFGDGVVIPELDLELEFFSGAQAWSYCCVVHEVSSAVWQLWIN